MNDNILLIGCTGFIGKCIIFNLLKNTNNNIYLIIRAKNNVSVEDRVDIILKSILKIIKTKKTKSKYN